MYKPRVYVAFFAYRLCTVGRKLDYSMRRIKVVAVRKTYKLNWRITIGQHESLLVGMDDGDGTVN